MSRGGHEGAQGIPSEHSLVHTCRPHMHCPHTTLYRLQCACTRRRHPSGGPSTLSTPGPAPSVPPLALGHLGSHFAKHSSSPSPPTSSEALILAGPRPNPHGAGGSFEAASLPKGRDSAEAGRGGGWGWGSGGRGATVVPLPPALLLPLPSLTRWGGQEGLLHAPLNPDPSSGSVGWTDTFSRRSALTSPSTVTLLPPGAATSTAAPHFPHFPGGAAPTPGALAGGRAGPGTAGAGQGQGLGFGMRQKPTFDVGEMLEGRSLFLLSASNPLRLWLAKVRAAGGGQGRNEGRMR